MAATTEDMAAVERRYRAFLADGDRRVFVHRFALDRRDLDFCICRSSFHGPLETLALHLRYGLIQAILALPWSWPKVAVLRLFGARVGRGTYVSQGVYVDPLYPQLLEVGEDVLLGYGARIFFHEITQRAFRVGRVTIGDRAIVGAGAIIRPGLRIGADAEVGALSAVTRSVAAGTAVFGVPAVPVDRSRPLTDDEGEHA